MAELLIAGGQLPARHLKSSYGTLATPRQILQKRQLRSGADDTLSALERVCLSGIIFHHRQTDTVFIPSNLLATVRAVPSILPPTAPLASYPSASTAQPNAFTCMHDLGVLLAFVQTTSVKPIHQRWLPATFLKQWGDHCAQFVQTPDARSEMQTQRRRFLHYIAAQMHLVTQINQQFVPTPVAWQWLQANPLSRLQHLWHGWVQPDLARWHLFRLPGYHWLTGPQPLLEAIHRQLISYHREAHPIDTQDQPNLALYRATQLATRIRLQEYALHDLLPANLDEPIETLTQTIVEIITGPLVWLGVLQPLTSPDDPVRITPWGQYWLGLTPAPDHPTGRPYTLTPHFAPDALDSQLYLHPSLKKPESASENSSEKPASHGSSADQPLPDVYDLMMIAVLTQSKHRGIGGNQADNRAVPDHQITATSFVAALQQGWSAPRLVQALQRLADRNLISQEVALLYGWAGAANKMRLYYLPVLETTDPAIITRLAEQRRGRKHIVRTVSPRAAVVDGLRLPQLVKRLTDQEGVPPHWEHRPQPSASQAAIPAPPPVPTSTQPNAYTLLALRVYQALGHYIALPTQLPLNTMDDLSATLDEANLAAVETAVTQTVSALEDALIGQKRVCPSARACRSSMPPWPKDAH